MLIIVKLLNSLASVKPTFCGFKSQGRRHYRTDLPSALLLQLMGQRAPRRKQVQQHLYSEQASDCVCDLSVVMCASCLSAVGKNEEICHLWPLL